MGNYKIIWTSQAKQDLENIYEYWKKKSVQGAKNVMSDILKIPKTIYYAKQYQVLVYAVLHMKRSPRLWKGRIK